MKRLSHPKNNSIKLSPLSAIFKETGLKQTSARVIVLKFILNSRAALSLNSLNSKLINELNRVTIYRVLKDFLKFNIISSFFDSNGQQYYELKVGEQAHGHFNCVECHKVICVSKEIPVETKLPKDYVTSEVSLLYIGLCPDCRHPAI